MGGVVDGGVGTNTSLWRDAIEKAQAELQQEYDVREERKRELDFLENGGNPLDFKFGTAATHSVQSTSLAGQYPEQLGTSEGKGSFARVASPYGDSFESSGNAGTPTTSEPHTADNLSLLDFTNVSCEGRRNFRGSGRSNVDLYEQSSGLDVNQKHKEQKEGIAHLVKNQSYARRNRSKSHRDGTRMSLGSTLPLPSACVGSRDSVVLTSQMPKYRDQNTCSTSNAKTTGLNIDSVIASANPDDQVDGSSKCGLDSNDFHGFSHKNEPDGKKTADLDSIIVPTCKSQMVLVRFESHPLNQESTDNSTASGKLNGRSLTRERKNVENEGQENCATMKGLDSESSCTQTSASLDRKSHSELCINVNNGCPIGEVKEGEMISKVTTSSEKDVIWKGYNQNEKVEHVGDMSKDQKFFYQDDDRNAYGVKTDAVSRDLLCGSIGSSLIEALYSHERHQKLADPAIGETVEANLSVGAAGTSHEVGFPAGSYFARISHEASILEEAKVIHKKRKGIAELSSHALPPKVHRKSHWGFVLEEMAWLANDFAQERVWKLTASAYVGHHAASAYVSKYDKSGLYREHKRVSHTLAQAVMQFWHSAECLDTGNLSDCQEDYSSDPVGTGGLHTKKAQYMMMNANMNHWNNRKGFAFAVQKYAARFLKENSTVVTVVQSEAPVSPNSAVQSVENIIYTVPPRAMEVYRRSIESHFVQVESFISDAQEEMDTSACGTTTDAQSESAGQGEAGDQSVYYSPEVLESNHMSKFSKKKEKKIVKSSSRLYTDVGVDVLFDHYLENKSESQRFGASIKRQGESLPVGAVPTKRMRTAYKQRIPSPFSAGTAGGSHVPTGAEASSGDTNSLHDDQSTLHGGCMVQRSLECESGFKFDSRSPPDYSEISKPRKKKMSKHLSFNCDKRWKLESSTQNEPREYLKRRPESLQADSNGTCVFSGQYNGKKQKITKNSVENAFDSPTTGSVPSPVASQMSNMSSPNKFIKLIGGRDRVRRSKILKISAGHQTSGSPWTLFEDQALIVLVHDMGPNWELVSDFLNGALKLKYIFRKSKECKARHKILMDRASGDGADSADDSGSSQPYPFTLPGIPKGSARQLFQCLQGPMEEETLMSHFEKIISIIKQQSYSNCQNDKREVKKFAPVHTSHILALSQGSQCPNNQGGEPLTPLKLMDTVASNSDVTPSLAHQGPQCGGASVSDQGPVLSSLDENSSLPGPSGVIVSGNVPSPPGFLSGSVRDSRYNLTRVSSLPVEEQQRVKQQNQLLSGRNSHQTSLTMPSVQLSDGTSTALPSANGLGGMCGMNRSIALSRQGLQVTGSSSLVNTGSMLSSGAIGIPSPTGVHSGAISSQGMSALKTRDAAHGMQSNPSSEHHRQIMMPEVQMQSQGNNSQAVPPFTGMNASFSNQMISTSQAYPHPQQHQLPSQQHGHFNLHSQASNTSAQQAYAFHLAKERHLQQQQQRMMRQQQQQVTSNALIPQVHPHIPTSLQNPPQIQSKACHPVSFSPMPSPPTASLSSQSHQKHQNQTINRNPHIASSGLANQFGKQKQRRQQQQFTQVSRPHPPLRPPLQSQQQVKLLQGVGRGNLSAPHNVPSDPCQLNGIAPPLGSQDVEKGDQTVQSLNGCQTFYSCSSLNPAQPPKALAPHLVSLSNPIQKLYSGMGGPMKQVVHLSSIPCNNQGSTLSVPSGQVLPEAQYSVNSQQFQAHHQPRQIQVNHCTTTAHRMQHKSWRPTPEPPMRAQVDNCLPDREAASNQQVLTTSTPPQPCAETSGAVSNASSVGSHWPPANTLYDDSHLSTVSGSSLKNSSGGEFMPASGQGAGQMHLSGGASPHGHGHNVGVQWQQKSHLHPSMQSSLTHIQQSQEQLQQQLSQDLVVQKQLHQQAGQKSLYIRPTTSRIE